jgi:hypothetical protein
MCNIWKCSYLAKAMPTARHPRRSWDPWQMREVTQNETQLNAVDKTRHYTIASRNSESPMSRPLFPINWLSKKALRKCTFPRSGIWHEAIINSGNADGYLISAWSIRSYWKRIEHNTCSLNQNYLAYNSISGTETIKLCPCPPIYIDFNSRFPFTWSHLNHELARASSFFSNFSPLIDNSINNDWSSTGFCLICAQRTFAAAFRCSTLISDVIVISRASSDNTCQGTSETLHLSWSINEPYSFVWLFWTVDLSCSIDLVGCIDVKARDCESIYADEVSVDWMIPDFCCWRWECVKNHWTFCRTSIRW